MIGETYGIVKPIKHRNCLHTEYPVYAWDTETPNYTIRLLSISDGVISKVLDVTSETILDNFIDFFRKIKYENIILFAHNLSFDFLVLLNLDLLEKYPQFLLPECHWRYRDVTINYFNGSPHFGDITYDDGKVLHLRDTFAYFGRIKLDTLSTTLGIGRKLEINKDNFYATEITKEFKEYAKEDARLTARIGQHIMKYHENEDVDLSVSAPNMAMKVFRKTYINDEGVLTAPSDDTLKYWELSYHGGKNGCYKSVPCELRGVHLYDINSAYPFAMTKIPNFNNCIFYQSKQYGSDFVGIYEISAESYCPYNSTFSHNFSPLKKLNHIWITSYELNSLLFHGCIAKVKIHNSILVEEREFYNPLAEYARNFYKLKSAEAKDSPLYLYYKVSLNSLYGKFIERREQDEKDYSLRGTNYNPAIASLITGYTRAQMHDMEHEGEAIHTATDAIFSQKDMHYHCNNDLGGISDQGYGTLKLLRTKLYLFYDTLGKLIKNARHGFHGSVEQLEALWGCQTKSYTYQKIPTAGEYFLHKKLNLKLFGMNTYKAKINIDWTLLDAE